MNVVSVALFDLDNTLVDRAEAFRDWASAFCDEHQLGEAGLELLRERDRDGFAARSEVFGAIRDRFAIAASVEDLIERYRLEYPRFYQPDEAVLSALRGLRQIGWRIGVVTNGPASQIEKIERTGLKTVIDAWSISEVLGVEKPDPGIFSETVRRCGGDDDSVVWMTGDAPLADVRGGQLAGCRTIWLHRTRTWGVADYRPDLVAASVLDAIRFISASSEGSAVLLDGQEIRSNGLGFRP